MKVLQEPEFWVYTHTSTKIWTCFCDLLSVFLNVSTWCTKPIMNGMCLWRWKSKQWQWLPINCTHDNTLCNLGLVCCCSWQICFTSFENSINATYALKGGFSDFDLCGLFRWNQQTSKLYPKHKVSCHQERWHFENVCGWLGLGGWCKDTHHFCWQSQMQAFHCCAILIWHFWWDKSKFSCMNNSCMFQHLVLVIQFVFDRC